MKKLLMMLFISLVLLGQEIELANDIVDRYSIDKFTNEIYFEQYYQPDPNSILKRITQTNFNGEYELWTELTDVPTFANLTHKYAYVKRDNNYNKTEVLERDLDTEIDRILYEQELFPFSYSPDDNSLYLFESVYNFKRDTIISYPEVNWQAFHSSKKQWSSDSTILALHIEYDSSDISIVDYSAIIRLNINTKLVDTLLIVPGFNDPKNDPPSKNLEITTYAYNTEMELLAVNIAPSHSTINTVKIYDFNSDEKELVCVLDSIRWGGSFYRIEEIEWSTNNDRLAMIADPLILSGGGLLIYSLTDSTLYEVFNPDDYYGVIRNLQWADNDKVTYLNLTSKTLKLYNILNVVSVSDRSNTKIENNLKVSNYPNPFNPTTTISFLIPQQEKVELIVYDVLGKKVAELINQTMHAGRHSIDFDGSNLSSGTYIYKITAGQFSESKKMVLIK